MDFEKTLQIEWLETNGLGGFASSTAAGINTRRYHGLLTAAITPPVGRYVLLSKLEETVMGVDLSSNLYPAATHPRGFEHLTAFHRDPVPTFTFDVGGVRIEKRVYMIHGENATVIEYTVTGEVPAGARLEIRPLIAFRDYHSTTHENGGINGTLNIADGQVSIEPYPGLPRLYIAHSATEIHPGGDWYRNFEYPVERERGLDYREDLYCPLIASFDLMKTRTAAIIASTTPHDIAALAELRENELRRRSRIRDAAPSTDRLTRELVSAADQFIVRRGDLYSIIAGYHWFADWGRDTMIALPGITLTTGRFDIAKSILLAYAQHIDQGMLPNRFPDDGGAPEYNTVDAALWFIQAVRAYLEYTRDIEMARRLYETLVNIIDWHLNGTRYGIHTDCDGLLVAGGPGTQLTWMDAKIGDFVATPRHGKPVEIQALWYNAIRFIADLADRFGDESSLTLLRELGPRIRTSFNREFWNEETGCLYDVIDGGCKDGSIRPNQLFAVALPHNLLSEERTRSVLAVIERELLTPHGLRTLAPSDPKYRGQYEGGPAKRDAIYHQGTVWPWLLGPFVKAYIASEKGSTAARLRAAAWLESFRKFNGLIPEILDGDAPHTARGCCHQAWSVGEILRALIEDIHQIKPTTKQGEKREDHSTTTRGRNGCNACVGR